MGGSLGPELILCSNGSQNQNPSACANFTKVADPKIESVFTLDKKILDISQFSASVDDISPTKRSFEIVQSGKYDIFATYEHGVKDRVKALVNALETLNAASSAGSTERDSWQRCREHGSWDYHIQRQSCQTGRLPHGIRLYCAHASESPHDSCCLGSFHARHPTLERRIWKFSPGDPAWWDFSDASKVDLDGLVTAIKRIVFTKTEKKILGFARPVCRCE